MPYFLILPAFVVYVVALSGAIVASSFVASLKPLRPRIVSVLGWSSAGFVLANLLYVVMGLAVFTSLPLSGPATGMAEVSLAVGYFFLLPFVLSAAGLLGGAFWGLRRSRNSDAAA